MSSCFRLQQSGWPKWIRRKPPKMDDTPTIYSDSLADTSREEVSDEEEVPEPYNPNPDSDILEISEKMFLTQINDIYYNFDEYKDKTIIVEGMYASFTTRDWQPEGSGYLSLRPGLLRQRWLGRFSAEICRTTPTGKRLDSCNRNT